MTNNKLSEERPLTVARRSLWYVVAYLVGGGAGLVLAPETALALLMSNGDYGTVFPQFAGLLMIALGFFVIQIIRLKLEVLYPTTLYVRGFLFVALVYLYVLSVDPLFLTVATIIGLGMVLTTASYTIDHSRARRPD